MPSPSMLGARSRRPPEHLGHDVRREALGVRAQRGACRLHLLPDGCALPVDDLLRLSTVASEDVMLLGFAATADLFRLTRAGASSLVELGIDFRGERRRLGLQ